MNSVVILEVPGRAERKKQTSGDRLNEGGAQEGVKEDTGMRCERRAKCEDKPSKRGKQTEEDKQEWAAWLGRQRTKTRKDEDRVLSGL